MTSGLAGERSMSFIYTQTHTPLLSPAECGPVHLRGTRGRGSGVDRMGGSGEALGSLLHMGT